MYVVVVVHVCKDKGLEDFWRLSVPDDMKQSFFVCMCTELKGLTVVIEGSWVRQGTCPMVWIAAFIQFGLTKI